MLATEKMSEESQYWSDRVLSQGQGDRFDRWVEFLGALVLAIATVATAWSAYQAALWGGDESKFYFEASAAQLEAAHLESRAMQRASFQASLFVEYAAALSTGDQKLADFLYQRFPEELERATDAWLATDPLTNPMPRQPPLTCQSINCQNRRLPSKETSWPSRSSRKRPRQMNLPTGTCC